MSIERENALKEVAQFTINTCMSTAQVSSQFKQILDYAATAAVNARSERVERAQVSKLMEIFESRPTREGIEILKMFILRQVQRREMGGRTAKALIEALSKINDPQLVRELLTYFRWIYEALELCRHNLPRVTNYEEVINYIALHCIRQ